MIVPKEIKQSENLKLHYARKNFYQLLHTLFSKPLTLEMYSEIKQNFGVEKLTNMFDDGKTFYEFFSSSNVEKSIKLAREDYYRLFVGPDSLLAPPWESVYRGQERSLFDLTTLEIEKLYNQFNLGIKKKENQHVEAADHIIFELEFMIILIERTLREKNSASLKYLLVGQKTMISDHLAKWIPAFSNDIHQHAKSKLFTSVSSMLASFIESDSEFIEELMPT